jgi:hypothetical protein
MTFRRTTPITALDLDSSDIPDAGALTKGGVTLTEAASNPAVAARGSMTARAETL